MSEEIKTFSLLLSAFVIELRKSVNSETLQHSRWILEPGLGPFISFIVFDGKEVSRVGI